MKVNNKLFYFTNDLLFISKIIYFMANLQIKRAKNVDPSIDFNTIELEHGEPIIISKTDDSHTFIIGGESDNIVFEQNNNLADVAFSGSYDDLIDKPTSLPGNLQEVLSNGNTAEDQFLVLGSSTSPNISITLNNSNGNFPYMNIVKENWGQAELDTQNLEFTSFMWSDEHQLKINLGIDSNKNATLILLDHNSSNYSTTTLTQNSINIKNEVSVTEINLIDDSITLKNFYNQQNPSTVNLNSNGIEVDFLGIKKNALYDQGLYLSSLIDITDLPNDTTFENITSPTAYRVDGIKLNDFKFYNDGNTTPIIESSLDTKEVWRNYIGVNQEEDLSSQCDGTNLIFTCVNKYNSLDVYLNGKRLSGIRDYSINNDTENTILSLTVAPENTDLLDIVGILL